MSTDVPPLEDVKMGLQSLGLVPAASTATTARLRLLTASRMKPLHQVQAAQAMAAKPHAQRNSIAREVAHYCSVPIATTRLDPRTRTRTVFKLPDAEVAKNYVVAAWRLLNQERKFLKKPEGHAAQDEEKPPSGAEQRAALVQRMVDATVPEDVIAFIEAHCHGKVYGARREKTDPSSSSPLYPMVLQEVLAQRDKAIVKAKEFFWPSTDDGGDSSVSWGDAPKQNDDEDEEDEYAVMLRDITFGINQLPTPQRSVGSKDSAAPDVTPQAHKQTRQRSGAGC